MIDVDDHCLRRALRSGLSEAWAQDYAHAMQVLRAARVFLGGGDIEKLRAALAQYDANIEAGIAQGKSPHPGPSSTKVGAKR